MAVAGNVGTPLASLVGTLDPDATVVCEVSSFQAEDALEFAPDTALLLNLSEDHLDRHGSFEAYRDAKLRMFARQRPDQVAVAPPGLELPGAARRIAFGDPAELPLPAEEIRLRGPHNLENAMGASAAALATGVPRRGRGRRAAQRSPACRTGSRRWATAGGVLYVNDSKATNVSAAARGIESFEGGVHAILGGSLKGGGFEGLRGPVAARCRACYLIGAAAGAAGRRPRARPACRCCAAGTSRRPCARPRRPLGPARWCCSRRPARATTSSATTRSAATASGRSCRLNESAAARRRKAGWPSARAHRALASRAPRPQSDRSSTRSSTPPRSACWRAGP